MINEGWAVVTVIGVWGWILAGVGFILQVFPTRDRFKGRSAAIWGGCFILFYLLWVVGMINA
jgi:drug/metabolite transporter superfamily protein YnfA